MKERAADLSAKLCCLSGFMTYDLFLLSNTHLNRG